MNIFPVIIGGFYRSGTSLLRRMIDAHSRFHCGPEVKFMKDFHGDYIDDKLRHGRFFSSARSFNLTEKELLNLFGSAFIRFHELAASRAGKARWADKNPENVVFLPAWQDLLGDDFLFVHVVRDPLDALMSLKEIGFHLTVPEAFEKRVALYQTFRERGRSFCDQHPERSYTLSYERLVASPREVLEELFAFAGEAFEPDVLTGFNSPERLHGLEDPKVSHTSKVHADSVGRGLRELDPSEVAIARAILGEDLGR